MRKINPHSLHIAPQPPQEFETGDPQTGVTVSLRLKKLRGLAPTHMAEKAQEYFERFVLGTGTDEPETLFLSGNNQEPEVFEVSRGNCMALAGIEMAQVPEKEEDRYSFEELAQMAAASTHVAAWMHEILAWVMDDGTPNSMNWPSADSPAQPSNGTESTPNLPPGKTRSSGASTSD